MECCGNTIKDLYGFSCPLKCSTYILQSVLFKKIIYIEKGCMNLHREISETIDLLDFIVELLCANLLVFN